jgi:hypothetical protein
MQTTGFLSQSFDIIPSLGKNIGQWHPQRLLGWQNLTTFTDLPVMGKHSNTNNSDHIFRFDVSASNITYEPIAQADTKIQVYLYSIN